ncbi:hypothetical protein ACFCX4_08305 [Kitasatospora sp. NPDC056327]|uniref:hypothetical protein n=1 Tax=Kitasatospora sp. NPDC056327 TaxID=3345785 RepID=UPI0035DED4A3
MTVFDDQWWSVFWPEMTTWVVALGLLLALLVIALREQRKPPGVDVITKACVYLDDRAVMDIYRMGRYTAALTQEVERRIRRGAEANITAFSAVAGVSMSEERIHRYVQVDGPIDVIGVIIKALDGRDGIIQADLRQGTVRKNRALARSKERTEEHGTGPALFRLSDAEDYVLLRGRFVAAEPSPDTAPGGTVFLAGYPGIADAPARIRVTCTSPGLSDIQPRAQTHAGYCLGTIQGWNPDTGTLDVHAIAVFR